MSLYVVSTAGLCLAGAAEAVKCRTPNHESYGALPATVTVSISGEGWTVNQLSFAYFANTAPALSLAYGPGLLQVQSAVLRGCLLDKLSSSLCHTTTLSLPMCSAGLQRH